MVRMASPVQKEAWDLLDHKVQEDLPDKGVFKVFVDLMEALVLLEVVANLEIREM